MKEHFTKCQEGMCEDVERFWYTSSTMGDCKNPVRQWNLDTISNIFMACIIMYNMILEDEQGLQLEPILDCGFSECNMRAKFSFHDL